MFWISLTYGPVGKRLEIEAENLGDSVEVWVLNSQTPEGVIHPVVEVSNGNLDSPVVFIVELHMPVYSDWAHMVSTFQQWVIVFLWRVNPQHTENFRVTPVYHKLVM